MPTIFSRREPTSTSSGTYKDMVQRMLDASVLLTAEEKQAVFYETAKRVFVKGGVRA